MKLLTTLIIFLIISTFSSCSESKPEYIIAKEGKLYTSTNFPNPEDGSVIFSSFKSVQFISLKQNEEGKETKGLRIFPHLKYRSLIYLPIYPVPMDTQDTENILQSLKMIGSKFADTVELWQHKIKVQIGTEKFIIYFQRDYNKLLRDEVNLNSPCFLYYYHLDYSDFDKVHQLLAIDFQSPNIDEIKKYEEK